jgi:hypothetical protein
MEIAGFDGQQCDPLADLRTELERRADLRSTEILDRLQADQGRCWRAGLSARVAWLLERRSWSCALRSDRRMALA